MAAPGHDQHDTCRRQSPPTVVTAFGAAQHSAERQHVADLHHHEPQYHRQLHRSCVPQHAAYGPYCRYTERRNQYLQRHRYRDGLHPALSRLPLELLTSRRTARSRVNVTGTDCGSGKPNSVTVASTEGGNATGLDCQSRCRCAACRRTRLCYESHRRGRHKHAEYHAFHASCEFRFAHRRCIQHHAAHRAHRRFGIRHDGLRRNLDRHRALARSPTPPARLLQPPQPARLLLPSPVRPPAAVTPSPRMHPHPPMAVRVLLLPRRSASSHRRRSRRLLRHRRSPSTAPVC